MTIEEFDKQNWGAKMKIKHVNGKEYDVVTVDFKEKLIGTENDALGSEEEKIMWVRCESCTLINKNNNNDIKN